MSFSISETRSEIRALENEISKLEDAKEYFDSTASILSDYSEDFEKMRKDVEDCAYTYRYVWHGAVRNQFDADLEDLVDVAESDSYKVLGVFRSDWLSRSIEMRNQLTDKRRALSGKEAWLAILELGDD